MLFRRQKTPTKNDGQELINKSNQQGDSVGDGTNDRVVLGYQKDGFGTGKDFGIKVSQDGFDVKTAADDELVMSSAFNMFKILATGIVDIPDLAAAGGSATEEVILVDTGIEATNKLVALGFTVTDTDSQILPSFGTYYAGGGAGATIAAKTELSSYVESGTVRINITRRNFLNAVFDGNPVRWYLLRETAQ